MKIQLLMNKTGLIYGDNNKRITCDKSGVLQIGGTNITIEAKKSCVLPILFYGASAVYDATFITCEEEYNLGKVEVRNGRISSPSPTAVEFMKVHHREDVAEKERDQMKLEIEDLKKIFDTNSLNFIIGGK